MHGFILSILMICLARVHGNDLAVSDAADGKEFMAKRVSGDLLDRATHKPGFLHHTDIDDTVKAKKTRGKQQLSTPASTEETDADGAYEENPEGNARSDAEQVNKSRRKQTISDSPKKIFSREGGEKSLPRAVLNRLVGVSCIVVVGVACLVWFAHRRCARKSRNEAGQFEESSILDEGAEAATQCHGLPVQLKEPLLLDEGTADTINLPADAATKRHDSPMQLKEPFILDESAICTTQVPADNTTCKDLPQHLLGTSSGKTNDQTRTSTTSETEDAVSIGASVTSTAAIPSKPKPKGSGLRQMSPKAHIAVGAGVGAVASGAGGTAMGAAAGVPLAPFTLGLSIPVGAAFGAGIGAVGGAVSGGVVGHVIHKQRSSSVRAKTSLKSDTINTPDSDHVKPEDASCP